MTSPNILIKQMYDVFGMRKQTHQIYLGDVAGEYTMDILRSMEKILDRKAAEEAYYMYIHARFDAVGKRAVRSVIYLLPATADIKKFKTLGTMCFYVNNRQGLFRKEWVLPYDRPVLSGILDPSGALASIGKDAVGMPVKALVF